jgi:malonyl CoA-acyl carrier protein transacylase
MISVAATRAEVETVLATLPPIGVVVPSNLNAPKQTVVSGAPEALEAASIALADRGYEVRKLNVPRAFHSPLMTGARSTLSEGLAVKLKAAGALLSASRGHRDQAATSARSSSS